MAKLRLPIKNPQTTSSGGIAMYVLLAVVILGAFFLASGQKAFRLSPPSPNITNSAACCDSGDGDACKPADTSDKTLTYKGSEYGLLKTQVDLIEGNLHLEDSLETFQGKPIIVNSSENHVAVPSNNDPDEITFIKEINLACERPDPVITKKDLYFLKRPADPYLFMRSVQPFSVINEYCTSIPDDEIIFVCTKNCTTAACSYPVTPTQNISCYGNANNLYDVYYRLSDYASSGIPDFIKNCDKSSASTGAQATVVPLPNQPERQNLQLQTFGLSFDSINPGLSPFCKPAIYLYPKTQTQVSVQVKPMGRFTHTDPVYPEDKPGGWNVIANPDGKINFEEKIYPYLYYEADIKSSLVAKPTSGYIVEKENVQTFLSSLLPRLGLSKAETLEMSTYWQKALPQSAYYFIGQIPQSVLDYIAPLTITPSPATIIRVALYFEPLDKKTEVHEPEIITPQRSGFTVVEWGGIVHSGKPFTCLQ